MDASANNACMAVTFLDIHQAIIPFLSDHRSAWSRLGRRLENAEQMETVSRVSTDKSTRNLVELFYILWVSQPLHAGMEAICSKLDSYQKF